MKKGLGRGLESLFSIYEEDEEPKQTIQKEESIAIQTSGDGVKELDMKLVDPNKSQPRKYFEPNALKELSESIKIHGIIQPIVVNEEKNGRYTIIAGERRFRASLIAGKTTIPAIIKHYDEKQVKEVSLVENLQREDLNPIEAAKAIQVLMDEYGFTQETVADRIGKSRPLVANTLRLLNLSPAVISLIEKNKISAGHGKCLVSIDNPQTQLEFANIVIENKLSVRDLEKLIKNYQNQPFKKNKSKSILSSELKEFSNKLQRLFGTKIKIDGTQQKGKIIINYFTQDDLDRIYYLISKLER